LRKIKKKGSKKRVGFDKLINIEEIEENGDDHHDLDNDSEQEGNCLEEHEQKYKAY
jgi:hypothetical protein